jgi:Carboxypeptidase regulatory-like domain/TonB dependent receptor-like, beta-barrel
MRVYPKSVLAFLSVLVLLGGLVYSQSSTTGAIEGRVTDDQGVPLPGAQVKLSSPDLIGGVQAKVTNAEGKYRFVALLRGNYALEASLAGFVTAKKDNIKVFVGETIKIDIALTIGKLEEEVTVKAMAPVVDVKDTQMNATNLDIQMLQTVGAEMRWKNSTNLINLAPGVKDGSAMGAPSSVSNQWQIDGQSLLTYVGDGEPWSYPDIDIIEEAKVSGSGANAEYGDFTGAMLNLVTKSGGNSFDGLLSASYSPFGWNQENFDPNDPLYSMFESPPRKNFFDFHAGLGGPIIKDKLWFYISGGTMRQETEIEASEEGSVLGTETQQIPKAFAKLTFQIDESNRLSAFVEYDYWNMKNYGLSVNRPAEATGEQMGPSVPIGVNFLHTFTENTFTEIKLGYYDEYWEQRPNQGRDVPQHYDWLTGMYSGNSSWWSENGTNQFTASAILTHHADDFIKGSHDFKVGVEYMRGKDNMKMGYSGGYTYTDNYYYSWIYYDYRYVTLAYTYGYDIKSNGWKASAFAQDSWTIGGRLTINAGLRWSMQRGYLPHLQEEAFFKPRDYLDPRIGLTFDIFGDHTTALKAHYGRFHESFKTWYFNGVDPNYEDWVGYELLPDGTKVELWRVPYSKPASMDSEIGVPYSDQFTFGLERTIMKDASVGVTFIYRQYKDFIGRVNMTAIWEKGPYTYEDENGIQQTIDVYRQTSAPEDDRFEITNPKAGMYPSLLITPENKYTGISFTFNKRFSDGWMFHVDYTYSQSKGNMYNSGTAAWGGNYFENPNRQINAYGYLIYDAPHALNIYGTISLPWGIVLTPRFTFQSGSNWTPYVQVGEIAGSPWVFLEDRGSERVPNQLALDLRLEKVFTFTERYRLGLILDAFNIFNRGVPTSVYGQVNGPNYGLASSVCDPAYFRVGMRLYF